jgi:hypothetical protein
MLMLVGCGGGVSGAISVKDLAVASLEATAEAGVAEERAAEAAVEAKVQAEEKAVAEVTAKVETTGSYKKDAPNAQQLLDGPGSEFSSAGADRFLVVCITTQTDAGAVVSTGVKYGGSSGEDLTKAGDQTVGTVNASVWYLQSPTAEAEDDGARFHVTAPSSADHLTLHVMTLFGVDQEIPVRTVSTEALTSQYPTAMASTAVNDIVFNCVAINSNTSAAAEGMNVVEIGTSGGETTDSTHRAVASYKVATGTAFFASMTTVSWELGASAAWASVALPIRMKDN